MFTNKESKSKTISSYNAHQRARRLKVLFCSEILVPSGAEIQWLPHPGTDSDAPFVILEKQKSLLEVLEFKPLHRSWFVNEEVSSDGKCFITVPFDITFLVLHYLKENCEKRAIPLENWAAESHPNLNNFFVNFTNKHLIESIADVKSSSGIVAYKYNKQKSLAWLAVKAKLLSETLKQRGINHAASATSSNYTISEIANPEEDKEYLEYACGIIENYVSQDIYNELLEYFSIDKENKGSKRKPMQYMDTEPLAKRVKVEYDSAIGAPKEKEKKVSSKKKALAKAAVGSKNISSFFKK